MLERALVSDACRRARKDGGLAQLLQRRTPAWGDRPKAADNVAQSRWRSQPANVKKPENSILRRSKDWSHCKHDADWSCCRRGFGVHIPFAKTAKLVPRAFVSFAVSDVFAD